MMWFLKSYINPEILKAFHSVISRPSCTMVSTSGPIPTHPGYDKSGAAANVYVDVPAPRVRPEAQQIYKQVRVRNVWCGNK